MDLVLQRRPSSEHATIGELTEAGFHQCWTLEDPVRERPGEPVKAWKVAGDTAIPAGRYRVEITYSQRFRRDLPLLIGVEGFAGVRIHPGNTHADTEGCILPGERFGKDVVLESRVAFNRLYEKIDAALEGGDEVWIDIRNP